VDSLSFNVAVTQSTAAGHRRLFPAGGPLPLVSTINYRANQTRSNNGIVRLGPGGLGVTCHQGSGTAHLIVDVNGYFKWRRERGAGHANESAEPSPAARLAALAPRFSPSSRGTI